MRQLFGFGYNVISPKCSLNLATTAILLSIWQVLNMMQQCINENNFINPLLRNLHEAISWIWLQCYFSLVFSELSNYRNPALDMAGA